MTPSEKARELANKMYYVHGKIDSDMAKKYALIAVDEIIKSEPTEPNGNGYYELLSDRIDDSISYWNKVKSEIEALI